MNTRPDEMCAANAGCQLRNYRPVVQFKKNENVGCGGNIAAGKGVEYAVLWNIAAGKEVEYAVPLVHSTAGSGPRSRADREVK